METNMKKILLLLVVTLSMSFAVFAQNNNPSTQNTSAAAETKKRPPIFRANKDQIMQVQKMLNMSETGKLDNETRAAIKVYQSANGLKATGTLNRATLEKMNITLTDKQKEIPVSPASYATVSDTGKSSAAKTRGPVFRATKDQIMEAQRILKQNGMYDGSETGKLDNPTREGLKKFQTANGMKATGTLNRATLEKMGVALTDRQRESQ
jgi:peptidoglycan hydrolase-like protein with peptidoglycan-binding domain